MKRISSPEEYSQTYLNSIEDSNAFWEEAAQNLHWFKKWDKLSSGDFTDLEIKWFEGATTNLSYNCIDRHLKKDADKTAVIFIANNPKESPITYTFKQLHKKVCQFANVLKDSGVKKGDVVCFYMSMVPELLIGVLACTRIGAIHSVVFGGFSSNALAGRINDCKAKILITNDGGYRGDKIIPLKDMADEALKDCPSIEKTLVSKRTNCQTSWNDEKDYDLSTLLSNASTNCPAEELESETPLFILYTSGSTGSPKGLLHTTGGYMTFAAYTFDNVFQMDKDDIYWCSADIGWITGHTYLTYGPLLNGNTTVMFEGVPTFPTPGRFWEVIDQLKVTHFYTAPTAIRALEACDQRYIDQADLSSLKVLGTVGEPINQEAWDWYNQKVGKKKCPIVDTWWQTETGGIMISSLAGVTESNPTYAGMPIPGINPILVDSDGNEINESGNLCIKTPWPSIARTIYGDHKRYQETYFSTYPGYYFTGDGAKRDESGKYRITGRIDDVINVSGHRIGTAEVEDAINQHPDIVESAVVGFPHKIKGQGIYAYVITTNDIKTNASEEINKLITKLIGPIAKADSIQIVSGLPKTRSGKIMRRILRKIAASETDSLGDTSTLLNPEIVQEIIQGKH